MAGIIVSGDTSGAVTLSAPAVAGTVTVTLPATSGTMLTTASSTGISGSAISSGTVPEAYGGTGTSTGYYGFKNRIINGGMVISQRGTSFTAGAASLDYTLDRWAIFEDTDGVCTVAQDTSVYPVGFTNSLKFTTTTADASLAAAQRVFVAQRIEGFSVSDLAWGTANAATVTLSFWVRSTLTGTFGGALENGSFNRSYPFTYTISTANTWEQKSVTIAGDTSGTWATVNTLGIQVAFGLGVGTDNSGTAGAWAASNLQSATGATSVIGTLNATWQISGVQLEKGSTATSFDYRPYGTELALCQRYYYKVVTAAASAEVLANSGFNESTTAALCWTQFPVSMRINPTAVEQTGTAANYQIRFGGSSANCSSVPTFNNGSLWGARTLFTVASGLTTGQSVMAQTAATAGIYLAWSAEL